VSPLVLYGPPAVGKDTITEALAALDPAYQLFPLLKAGVGRSHGYRMVGLHQLGALASAGDLILRWNRYGSTYAIDRQGIEAALANGQPVLHFAERYHVETLIAATPAADWLIVGLTCPRPIAAQRLVERNPDDVQQRLAVFDQVEAIGDLGAVELDTSILTPEQAAKSILGWADRPESPVTSTMQRE
jgi:guanylate kinase